MIIYCDLTRPPIFHQMFEDSGERHLSHYKSMWRLYLERKLRGRIPEFFLYPRPNPKEATDTFIVFDSYASDRYLRWLCQKAPYARIIVWFWNPIGRQCRWREYAPSRVEFWSYSKSDCAAFHLRHNTQFFFDCLAEEARIERDKAFSETARQPPKVFFVGRDKGRSDVLHTLADQLRGAGAEVELEIVVQSPNRRAYMPERLLTYRQIIDRTKEADILLDYTMNPDAGLSMRPMEALFFGKKLITNNREILQADFYRPENIYVLENDKRTLNEFLLCPMRPVPDEIRDRYLMSAWLKRFSE